MPLIWNLREWLAVNKKIYRATDLQELIIEKTGVYLSIPTLSALMTDTPGALRVKTIGVLCTALGCKLSEFCDYEPDAVSDQKKKRKAVGEGPEHLYKYPSKQAPKHEGSKFHFPDPRQFQHGKRDLEEDEET